MSKFNIKKAADGDQELPGEKMFTEKTKIKVTGNIRVIVLGVIIGTLIFGIGGVGGQLVQIGIERARQEAEYTEKYLSVVQRCVAESERVIGDTSNDDIKNPELLGRLRAKSDEAKQLDAGEALNILRTLAYGGDVYFYDSYGYCVSGKYYDGEHYYWVNGNENDGNPIRQITDILNQIVGSKAEKAEELRAAQAAEEKRKAEEEAKKAVAAAENGDCSPWVGAWKNGNGYSMTILGDCSVTGNADKQQIKNLKKSSDGSYKGDIVLADSPIGGAAIVVYPAGVKSYSTYGTKTAVGDDARVRILITQSVQTSSELKKALYYKQ